MVREVTRMKKFDALDKDGDGQLAKADVPADLYPIFNNLDSNRDGIVTREEVVLGGDDA
jgi:Ca2+-binding EF-hand superfamily protein